MTRPFASWHNQGSLTDLAPPLDVPGEAVPEGEPEYESIPFGRPQPSTAQARAEPPQTATREPATAAAPGKRLHLPRPSLPDIKLDFDFGLPTRLLALFMAIALSAIGLRAMAMFAAISLEGRNQAIAEVIASPRTIFFLMGMLAVWSTQLYAIADNRVRRICQQTQAKLGALGTLSKAARWLSFSYIGLLLAILLAAPQRGIGILTFAAILMAIASMVHGYLLDAEKSQLANERSGKALADLNTQLTGYLNFAALALCISLRATAWIQSIMG